MIVFIGKAEDIWLSWTFGKLIEALEAIDFNWN